MTKFFRVKSKKIVKIVFVFARISASLLVLTTYRCCILNFSMHLVITFNLNILNIIPMKIILNGTKILGAPRIFSKIYTVV